MKWGDIVGEVVACRVSLRTGTTKYIKKKTAVFASSGRCESLAKLHGGHDSRENKMLRYWECAEWRPGIVETLQGRSTCCICSPEAAMPLVVR